MASASTPLSAAELERRHNPEPESATDPFPAAPSSPNVPSSSRAGRASGTLDTSSQTAFPSLAAAPAPTPPVNGKKAASKPSQWTAGSQRIKDKGKGPAKPVGKAGVAAKPNGAAPGPAVVSSRGALHTDSLMIDSPALSSREVAEIMKTLMSKFGVKIESSTATRAGVSTKTFIIKGQDAKAVDNAKKALSSSLSPVITVTVEAPVSTIGTIIGPKGASLKQLRDQTNVRIDIPRREEHTQQNGHADHDAGTPGAAHDADNVDEQEPTVTITISGPTPGVKEAQAALLAIVATKTSRTSAKVSVPVHFWPFVAAKKDELEAGKDVKVFVPRSYRPDEDHDDVTAAVAAEKARAERERAAVLVSGEREAVAQVAESVKALVEHLENNTNVLKFNIPKRQHRFLAGEAGRHILEETGCSVELAPFDDPSDEVIVRGPNDNLSTALTTVMKRAASVTVLPVDLLLLSKSYPSPSTHAAHLLAYLTRSGRLRKLTETHPDVKFYSPRQALVEASGGQLVSIDVVGAEKAKVEKAREELMSIVKSLGPESIQAMEVEPLTHRFLIGKRGQKLKAFQDAHGVDIVFPPESAESSTVLLVHTRTTDPALDKKARDAEIQARLESVKEEVDKLAKEVADMKSETIKVEKKWHRFVVGQNGTTLNGIIGEDKAIMVKLGSSAKPGAPAKEDLDEDSIYIRGPKDQVDRAVKEILQIVEDAKNDDIVNGFTEEFLVSRDYVGRIVGSGGSGLNKLRDELGVRIDINDKEEAAVEDPKGKKKKKPDTQATVKITGRKENVTKAKERILAQIERMADETTETLRIPAQYHSSLIGSGGKYAVRLEEKYGVKVTFPREKESDEERRGKEGVGKDEVLLRGGKKGVAAAKAELLEAVEFEKESNVVVKFTVPTSAVARIVGKGGQQINEIKETTEATVDIDRSGGNATTSSITVRGSKKATEAAKKAILAIASNIDEEITLVVNIESKYHRGIIGAGGQGLREMVVRCGGPTDPSRQAGLVHFPRQGEAEDEVRLRGERKLVEKIKAELEKIASGYRDRIVLAVSVPVALHSALIGRAGKRLQELQETTGAQIQFPGSRSYGAVGQPENADDVKDADPQDVVKVYGSRAACEKAITELKQNATTFGAAQTPRAPRASQETFTSTKSVPLRYHHTISQGGTFFRNLRSYGVNVDHSRVPEKPVPKAPNAVNGDAPEARIDQPLGDSAAGAKWEVLPNNQNGEEEEAEWTLRAKDKAGLERAEKALEEAVEHAASFTHVGYLTLPDRSSFPRIVGSKGSTIGRIREETGANIDVGRENNVIMITGSESSISAAKEAIEAIVGSGRRDY